MNKIYKVVWNAVRGCYVVASELASSRKGKKSIKNSTPGSRVFFALLLAAVASLGLETSPVAWAAEQTGSSSFNHQYVLMDVGGNLDSTKDWNYVFMTDDNSIVQDGSKHDGSTGGTLNENTGVITGGNTVTVNGKSYTFTNYKQGVYTLTSATDSGDTIHAYRYGKYTLDGPKTTGHADGKYGPYRIRDGYKVTIVEQGKYHPQSNTDMVFDVTYTGDENDKPLDILEKVDHLVSFSGTSTNLNEHLQTVTASTFTSAATGGSDVKGNWDYYLNDNGTYTNVKGGSMPQRFVAVTDSRLTWDDSLQQYTYNGQKVNPDNLYVIGGQLGIFTSADGNSVYTGPVYGSGNELLLTTSQNGKYYSFWGAQNVDPGQTMNSYPVSKYNADIQTLTSNDTVLAHNDINKVTLVSGSDNQGFGRATINLVRNGTNMNGTNGTDNTAANVDGTLTITASGGAGGNGPKGIGHDKALTFAVSGSGSRTFMLGSEVGKTGNGGDLNGNNLESLTINGQKYGLQTIYQGDDGQNVTRNLSRSLKLTGGVGTTGTSNLLTDKNNIGVTKVSNTDDTLRISLNKDIDLSQTGSLTIGDTAVNTSGITVKVSNGDVSLTNAGVNAGNKAITNVASGGNTGTNAANISDVHTIAKEDVQVTAGKNLANTETLSGTVRTDTLSLQDNITLGGGTGEKAININGPAGTITLGDANNDKGNYVSFDGSKGLGNVGDISIGKQDATYTIVNTVGTTAPAATTENGYYILNLGNTEWNPREKGIVKGRAATEDQLAAAMPHYFSISSNADGTDKDVQYGNYWNTGATGNHAMAIGHNVTASGDHSIAIGDGGMDTSTQTTAKGTETLAIGYQTTAEGERSIAIGNKNKANGIRSVSLGMDVQAGYTSPAANVESDSYEDGTMTGGADIAVGNRTRVYGTGSTAIGFGAKVGESKFTTTTAGNVTTTTESMDTGADMAMALGGRSQAMVDGGVALGNLSYANRAAGSVGTNTATGDTATTVYLDPSGTTGDVNMGTLKATFNEDGTVKDAGSTDNLQAGTAWRANMGAISIGGDARTGTTASGHEYTLPKITRQLTGLAAGSQDTDAVNVAQLKALTTKGLNFQGNNENTTVHTDAGDTLKIQGTNHNIQVTGDNTVKGLSIGLDTTVDVNTLNAGSYSNSNNVQGTINLVGQNRQGAYKAAKITAEEGGGTTNKNVALDGSTTQRLQYVEDTSNTDTTVVSPTTHTLATLEDDGLKFTGDTGSADVKLDKQVNIKGNAADLSGSNNIGVAATSDENGNATLTLRLAKDVTGLNSVTAGTNTRVGDHAAGTLQLKNKEGADQSGQFAAKGDYVTGLDNTDWDVDNPTYVSGRAATEDELKTVSNQVSQNKTDIAGHETRISNVEKGWNLKANGENGSANIQAGDTVTLNTVADTNSGNGAVNNLSVTRGGADGKTVSFSLNKNITLGTSSGTETGGKLTVNSGRSSTSDTRARSVEIDGNDVKVIQDNSVRAKLSTSEYGGYLELGGGNLPGTENAGGTVRLYRSEDTDSTGISRLAYVTVNNDGTFSGARNTIAALSDGIAVSGDTTTDDSGKDTSATGNKVKLNKKLAVNGDDNITTTSTAAADDGASVKVALKSDLTGINSISGNGSTISLTNGGISLGAITDSEGNITSTVNVNNQKITGVAAGDVSSTSTDAINGSQLKAVQDIVDRGWGVFVNGKFIKDIKLTDSSDARILNFAAATADRNEYSDNLWVQGRDQSNGRGLLTFGTKPDVNYKTVRVGGTKGKTITDDEGNPITTYTGGILIGSQNAGGTTGKYITGLDNKTWVVGTTAPVDGRAATENQLKSVSDEVDTLKNGWNLALNDGQGSDAARAVKTGQTVTIDNKQTSNNRGNIQISRSTDTSGNQTVSLGLNKDIQLGNATGGTDNGGSLRVNKGTENAHISITGDSVKLLAADADTLTNERVTLGYDASDGGYITLGGGGTDNSGHMRLFKNTDKDSTGMARLAYVDPESDMNPGDYHTIATLEDGTTYAGDTGTDTKVALNKKVTVTGSGTASDGYTTGNISVNTEATTTDGNADGNAKLTIQMKKNLDGIQSIGQNGNTIAFGDTAGKGITLNGGSLDVGGNKITNLADGTANSDAVNYGQLTNAAAGWDVQTNTSAADTTAKSQTISTAKDSTSRSLTFAPGKNMNVYWDGTNPNTIDIATQDDVAFSSIVAGSTAATGGGIKIGYAANTVSGDSSNPAEGNYITGLSNLNFKYSDTTFENSNRAATESQLYQAVKDINAGVVANDKFVTGGSVTYDDKGAGNGLLDMSVGADVNFTGLKNNYVSDVKLDGNKLTITRNDAEEGGLNADKKTASWTVDLSGLITPDMRLVGAGADQTGAYTADSNGDIHLTVTDGQEGDGHTRTITISGLATNFGANSSQYKVNGTDEKYSDTHKVAVGQTQKIIGSAAQTGRTYADTNITTELDKDGNIHILMDANPTIQSVTFKQGDNSTTLNLANEGDKLYYTKNGDTTNKNYIATTDEGLSFQGNNTGETISKKLSDSTPLKIVGDADQNHTDVAEGNNVYVTGNNTDGSLKIQLGEDISGFTTVQAGDTTPVKIGTHAANSLSYSDKDGNVTANKVTEAGDFVTGLDNKTWTSGQYVSGRAATEDQLEAVAKSVTNTVTGQDKYVTGATFSDGENGAIDGTLTVANGTNVKTTGLHDYYVTKGEVTTDTTTAADGTKTTKNIIRLTRNNDTTVDVDLSSLVSTDYQLVANPADGSNGYYTPNADGDIALTVKDTKTGTTQTVTLKDVASKAFVDKGMNFGANSGTANNVKLGGQQTIKGRALNTDESISETAGSNTFSTKNVTTTMNNGDIVINLADNPQLQSVILNGAGSNQTITLKAGDDNRLTYTVGGSTKKVATTDDGMSFVGDNSAEVDGVLTNKLDKKLTETLAIKGGADAANLSDKNIGVTIEDGQINVKLAKDVTGLNTVTAGDTTGNKTGVIVGYQDDKGTPAASGTGYEKGNFITGLSNTSWNPLEDPVDGGRAATEDQVKAVEQQVTYAYKHNGKTETAEDNPYGGYGLTGDNSVTVKQDIGKAITVKGGSNISTSADKNAKSLTIDLSQNLTSMQSATFDQAEGDNTSTTVINAGGVTITPKKDGTALTGNDVISLGTTGLSNGNNQIKYVASGVGITGDESAKDKLNKIQSASGDDLKNAVNVGDLQAAVGGAVSSMNLNFQGNTDGVTISRGDDATLKIQGSGEAVLPGYEGSDNKGWGAENIRVEADAANGTLTINTAKDFHVDTLRAGTAGSNTDNDRAGHIKIAGPSANTAGTYEYVDITSGYNASASANDGTNPAGRSDTNGITRLHYQNLGSDGKGVNNTAHTVATLDDGLYLSGDLVNDSVPATDAQGLGIGLNRKVTLTGGAADNLTAVTDKNIGVTVTKDENGNAAINLLLNKDLSGLNSVQAGDAKIGKQTVHYTTNNTTGDEETGSYVTGLGNVTWDPASKGIVKGRAATEDQLKAVQDSIDKKVDEGTYGFIADSAGDEKNTAKKITTVMNKEIAISGETLSLPTEAEVKMTRSGVNTETYSVVDTNGKRSGQNIKTKVSDDNKTLLLQLSNQLALGDEKENGRIDLYGTNPVSEKDTSIGTDHNRIHMDALDGISLRHTDGTTNQAEQLDGVSITGPHDNYAAGYTIDVYADGRTTMRLNGNEKGQTVIHHADGSTETSETAGRVDWLDTNGSIAITNAKGQFTARLSDVGATGYLGLGNTVSTLQSNPLISNAEQIQTVTTTDKDGNKKTDQKVARIAMYTHYGEASLNDAANVTGGKGGTVTNADGSTTTYSAIGGRYSGQGAMTRLKYLDEEGFNDDGTTTGRASHTLATLDDGLRVGADGDLGDGSGNYGAVTTQNERGILMNNKLQFTGNSTVTAANALKTHNGINLTGSSNVGVAVYDDYNTAGQKNILIALKQDQKGFNTIQVGGLTNESERGSNAANDASNPETIRIGNLTDSSSATVGLTLANSTNLNTVSTSGQAVNTPLYEAQDANGNTYYTSDAQDANLTKLYKQANNSYSKNKTDLGVMLGSDGNPYKIEYGSYWSEVKAGDTASSAVVYRAQDGNGKTYYTTDANDSHIVVVNGEKQQVMTTLNAATGRYMTGLSNTAWDGQRAHLVTDRAATEGQLQTAQQNVSTYNAYDNTNKIGGGYGVKDGSGTLVKRNLGQDITIRGDADKATTAASWSGNVTTKAEDTDNDGTPDTLTASLNKDVRIGTAASDQAKGVRDDGSLYVGGVTIDNTGVDYGGKQGKKLASGLGDTALEKADGDTLTNAVNVGDLQKAANAINNNVNKGISFQGDAGAAINRKPGETLKLTGGETDSSKLTTEKNIGVVRTADDELQIRLAKELNGLTSVTTGNTTIDNSGITVKNGDTSSKLTESSLNVGNKTYIDSDGINANNQKITGVARGEADTDAVNMSQLKEVSQKASEHTSVTAGNGIKVTEKTNATGGKEYNVALEDKVTFGSGENAVTVDGTKGSIKTGDVEISKDGINAGKKQITNVKSGLDGKKLSELGDDAKELTNAANIGDLRDAAKEINTSITNINDTIGKGLNFQGDDGEKVNRKLDDTLKLSGGAKKEDLTDKKYGNIGVVKDGDGGLSIRLAKKLDGLESVTTGNTVMNDSGITINNGKESVKLNNSGLTISNGPSVTTGGVNYSGTQGKNMASGINGEVYSKDASNPDNRLEVTNKKGDKVQNNAANIGDVYQIAGSTAQQVNNHIQNEINQVNNNINKLGTRVNRVGANAAALAALHPLDFDPDNKLDFSAGTGHYSGASAVAVGAYYRPTEDIMISLGGSSGGGENMVNAGVSFKLGNHNHVTSSRVAMAKEIRDLRGMVVQLMNTVNAQQAALGKPLVQGAPGTGTELFPDVPKNHWAYEYVEKLHRSGILDGYPDGQFKGNRMMTRYEFASLLYHAIMNGAAGNPELSKDGSLDKLSQEFSPELQYINIQVVARDKNGNPTIERVRTVPQKKEGTKV